MTITLANRKGTNAWEIPSMKTYLSKLQDEIKTEKFELNKFHASKNNPFY
jgi:hypothetical protein